MGFLVTASIETSTNQNLDNFYVRIEDYKVDKSQGYLWTVVAHYTDKIAAEEASVIYQEDYIGRDASGFFHPTFTYNSDAYNWSTVRNFPLTEEEEVTITTYSSSFVDSSVDYIDFDDDCNEITKTRTERSEVVTTGSGVVTKNKININLITGSVYEYAYKNVIEFYQGVFGASNVNNQI